MRTLTIFLIIACGILLTSCENAIAPLSDLLPTKQVSGDQWPGDQATEGDITIIITWGSPDSSHTDSVRVIIPKNSEVTYEWREN